MMKDGRELDWRVDVCVCVCVSIWSAMLVAPRLVSDGRIWVNIYSYTLACSWGRESQ